MNKRIKLLKDAVIVLASDATAQLEYLRKLGLPGGIDELALEYDAIAAAADDMLLHGELDKNQYDSVKKLNALLSRMGGKANASIWTPNALSSSDDWMEVRSLAKESLRSLK